MTKEKAIADIFKAARDNYPDNILFVMPEDLSKKLKSFMLIREDLLFISEVAQQLIFLKESSPTFNEVIELALWQSIIVTYGKCFTASKAGMSKLEKSVFVNVDEKYSAIHEHLMELRHKYIAHRDDTANEQALVFIKISHTGFMLDGDTEDIIIARKLASPRVGDLRSLLTLLELLIEDTSDKIQTAGDKAHNRFIQKYTVEQAKAFLVS